jgi:hypothetical protein
MEVAMSDILRRLFPPKEDGNENGGGAEASDIHPGHHPDYDEDHTDDAYENDEGDDDGDSDGDGDGDGGDGDGGE